MNIKTAFPSEFLRVEDLNGKPVTLVMDSVEIREIGQGKDKEQKPILSFRKTEKKMVLNVTNSNTIASLYGDETDTWSGQRITLVPREVEYQGRMVWAIRVSLQKPAAGPAKAPAEPPPVDPDEHVPEGPEGEDSEVPF